MKSINGFLLGAVVVVATGCVSSAPENKNVLLGECAFAQQSKSFKEECDTPKLGWKGANGSDFIISQ